MDALCVEAHAAFFEMRAVIHKGRKPAPGIFSVSCFFHKSADVLVGNFFLFLKKVVKIDGANVGVQYDRKTIPRKGDNGCSRVGADAGESFQLLTALRHNPLSLLYDRSGKSVEVLRAPIVAESLPHEKHFP